jgi:predicted alpha/beta-fold hydrolase
MSEGGTITALQQIWEKIFQPSTRKEVFLTSVVGLCGLGLFWGTRRLLATTAYEQQLVKYGIPSSLKILNVVSIGESEYIKSHISFIDLHPYRIRIFHARHSFQPILPKPIPLIVFIHGLGGQINQFEPLLKCFCQVADVLAVDLPGCGGSPLTNRNWDLYTTEALTTLVHWTIEDKISDRKVVIIGHSLGSLIAGSLALKLEDKCLACVLLCPKAKISEKERRGIRFMTRLPEFIFNIFRKWDRMYTPDTCGLMVVVGLLLLV